MVRKVDERLSELNDFIESLPAASGPPTEIDFAKSGHVDVTCCTVYYEDGFALSFVVGSEYRCVVSFEPKKGKCNVE